MGHKALIVVQDGIGDRPIESLGGRTPLEAAHSPFMDSLAARGQTGMMDLVGPETEVATDTGHLALFGQDADNREYRRGPMEAAGVGFDVKSGDVAVRFNFATVDSEMQIRDRRAGRIREDAGLLVEALNRIQIPGPVQVFFRRGTEHRGVLVLRGPGLSPNISDADPGSLNSHRRLLVVRPTEAGSAAQRTAEHLNQVIKQSHAVLRDHPVNKRRLSLGLLPANIILTRGAGTSQNYINLPRSLGLRIACVCAEATVAGLARLAGLDIFAAPGMTANLDTDLYQKADQVLLSLESYDLVYLHLKGCDIAAHDRSPLNKKAFIERTDAMVGSLLQRLEGRQSIYFAFVGDHSTLSETGEHSSDPVPVFMTGPGIPADAVTRYGERYCAQGDLGRIHSSSFLSLLFGRLKTTPELGRGIQSIPSSA